MILRLAEVISDQPMLVVLYELAYKEGGPFARPVPSDRGEAKRGFWDEATPADLRDVRHDARQWLTACRRLVGRSLGQEQAGSICGIRQKWN